MFVTGAAAYTSCGLGNEAFWSCLRGGVNGDLQGGAPRRAAPPEMLFRNDRKIKMDHPLASHMLATIEHDLGQFLKESQRKKRNTLESHWVALTPI